MPPKAKTRKKSTASKKQSQDKARQPKRGRGRPRAADIDVPTETIIADAALQEFAAHGYEGSKIANIAKRANVVTPAVHYHFKTKLDLWKAAVDHAFRDFDALTRSFQADLRDLDPLSMLKVIVRRYTTIVFNNPARIRIILLEGLRDTERSRWLIKKHLIPSHEESRALFTTLADSGIIKPYSSLTILSMLGGAAVTELANTHMVGQLYGISEVTEEVVAEKADAIIDIMFTGILAT